MYFYVIFALISKILRLFGKRTKNLVFLHNVFCLKKHDFSYIPLDKNSNLWYNKKVISAMTERVAFENPPQRAAVGEKRCGSLCEKHFGACERKRVFSRD